MEKGSAFHFWRAENGHWKSSDETINHAENKKEQKKNSIFEFRLQSEHRNKNRNPRGISQIQELPFQLKLSLQIPLQETSIKFITQASDMEKHLIQPLIAVAVSSLIALRSYRRKSLDLSGAFAGFLVMSVHLAAGYR